MERTSSRRFPKAGDQGFLLGVSGKKLLLDGIPLKSGQAERSFAQLLTTAGLASINFSSQVTIEDFARLVRAFAVGGSKGQDVAKQIKETLGDGSGTSIRINEVKFVAADPGHRRRYDCGTDRRADARPGIQAMAERSPETASADCGGGRRKRRRRGSREARLWAVFPTVRIGGGGGGGGTGSGTGTGTGGGWDGKTVPLQEEEVVQAIRLLTRFSEVSVNPNVAPEDLQKELGAADPNTRVNLQQLLESLASNVQTDSDTPLLMKAAEHMAIRFALERYQKGEVKVNAVHQMIEHMSRQMDTLRQILRVQEEKMGKAGLLVESHADILDRMFWAEVPEAGKKSVLIRMKRLASHRATCASLWKFCWNADDKEAADEILRNYFNCLDAKDAEVRAEARDWPRTTRRSLSRAGRRSDGLQPSANRRPDLQGTGYRIAEHVQRSLCPAQPGSQHAQELRSSGCSLHFHGTGCESPPGAGE